MVATTVEGKQNAYLTMTVTVTVKAFNRTSGRKQYLLTATQEETIASEHIKTITCRS